MARHAAAQGLNDLQCFFHPQAGLSQISPFTLSQGMPLLASQNFDDPFFIERQATTANPLTGGVRRLATSRSKFAAFACRTRSDDCRNDSSVRIV